MKAFGDITLKDIVRAHDLKDKSSEQPPGGSAIEKQNAIITFSSSNAESGKMTGRNDSEWGQIGVNSMHGTFGCTCSANIPDTLLRDNLLTT